jgi:hypothetical protein
VERDRDENREDLGSRPTREKLANM